MYRARFSLAPRLNVEDLIGNVEVVVFPQVYERYSTLLVEDAKVFIRGRVSLEEDKDGKLICDQIISFEDAQAVITHALLWVLLNETTL